MASVILLPYANPSPTLSEPRLHHLRLEPEAFPGASSNSPWFVQHLLEAYGVMLSLPAPGIALEAKTFQVEGRKSPFPLLPESRRRSTGVLLTWQAACETTALHVSPVGWQARSIAKGVGDGNESRAFEKPLSILSLLSSGSVSPSRPSEDARSRSFGPTLLDKALHLLYVPCGLGLPFQTSRRHVADLAKDFPLLPTPVVLAEDPGDVGVGVRVPAVQEILVVEVERRRIGLAGRGAPLQDLLSPVHPHVVVHVAGMDHLSHRRVPILVVGLG